MIRLTLIFLLSIWIAEAVAAPPKGSARHRIIDFDDQLVEGLNKRPLDSLSQLSEKDGKRKRSYLYKKRSGFRSETADTLRELRFQP